MSTKTRVPAHNFCLYLSEYNLLLTVCVYHSIIWNQFLAHPFVICWKPGNKNKNKQILLKRGPTWTKKSPHDGSPEWAEPETWKLP